MKTATIRTCETVSVPQAEAFALFTERIGDWYHVAPGTVPNPDRTATLRMDGRVGGHFVAVTDPTSGDGDLLGTITAWDPPERVAWTDGRDCEVEVRFAANEARDGTEVSIELRRIDALDAAVAEEVRRHGWHTTLAWFADAAGRRARRGQGLTIYLFYEDASGMMDWYAKVFGFREIARWSAADGTVHNGEMAIGDGSGELWLDGGGPRYFDRDGNAATPWTGLFVDDLDAFVARARAAGLDADPPERKEYGVTMWMVTDPSGHLWGFMELSDREASRG